MFTGPLGEYFGQRTCSMVVYWRRSHGSCFWETRIWHPPRPYWTRCTSHASGPAMVTVGMAVDMVVGMVLLQVTGKRTSPVRPRILPSPVLPQKWHRGQSPYSLDDFLVVEMFINEGSWPTSVGQVESEGPAAFRSQETPLFLVNDGFFRCLRHASWCNQLPIVTTVFGSTLAPFQTSCTWSCEHASRSECNLLLRERDFFVLLYCNTQSYCIRERFVSLSYAWI